MRVCVNEGICWMPPILRRRIRACSSHAQLCRRSYRPHPKHSVDSLAAHTKTLQLTQIVFDFVVIPARPPPPRDAQCVRGKNLTAMSACALVQRGRERARGCVLVRADGIPRLGLPLLDFFVVFPSVELFAPLQLRQQRKIEAVRGAGHAPAGAWHAQEPTRSTHSHPRS